MSYVQGTVVRLEADFSDPLTRLPVTPTEIVLTIEPPTGATFERTLSAGQVVPDVARSGRFYSLLDTEPEPGTWRYQFEDPSGATGVVEHKAITVRARLAPASA